MDVKISNSLVNVGEISQPVDTFIKKVSKGIGGGYVPFQIVLTATAEVKAAKIKAEGEIEINDLHRRARHRVFAEEIQRQQN